MGNCFANCKAGLRSLFADADVVEEQAKVLKIVKIDGKVLTFRKPMLVKDILVNFSDSAIGISKQASQPLPPNYELKMGKVYYVFPSICLSSNETVKEETGSIRRVKIVITKQQLQELLSKQISVVEVLSGLERSKQKNCMFHSSISRKPKLESIPEGYEQRYE